MITPRGIRRDHRPVASKSAASAQQAPQQRARCKHSQCVAWTWHGSRTAACDDRTATVSSRKHPGTHKGWSQDTLSARLLVSIHRQSKVHAKHEAAWAVRVITRLSSILSTPRQCNLSTLSKVSVFTNGTFDSATRDAPPPLRNPGVIAAEYYRRAPCRAALRDADGGWGMRDAHSIRPHGTPNGTWPC